MPGWITSQEDDGRLLTRRRCVPYGSLVRATAHTKENDMASHTGHDHPATPAARAACRAFTATPVDASGVTRPLIRDLYRANANQAAQRAADAPVTVRPATPVPTYVIPAVDVDWTDAHCSSCGSTDPEDTAVTYSGCCNKRVCTFDQGDITCCPANATATGRPYR
jgi:hypothetical protein